MKKSYVYFAAPLVGVAIFAAVYWQYAAGYEEKLANMEKQRLEAKAAKTHEENLAKRKAIEDALRQQEERKKAKAEKEAREAKEKEERELAVQARVKVREEARKFQEQVTRLKKEVEENKKEIAKIDEEKKRASDEEKFQKQYVAKAQANTKGLQQVIERIDAADKAADAAAKAAAEAAKAAAAAAKK